MGLMSDISELHGLLKRFAERKFHIVAIEGADGVGKTTAAKAVCKRTGATYMKYPDEDEYFGKLCRAVINGDVEMDPAAFQGIQTLNRLLTLEKLLEAGEKSGLVILDRYKASAIAYGCTDGVPITVIKRLNELLPDPDWVMYIHGKDYRGGDGDIYADKQTDVIRRYINAEAVDVDNWVAWCEIQNDRDVVDVILRSLRWTGYIDSNYTVIRN